MIGITSWEQRKTLLRLVAIIVSHSSSVMVSNGFCWRMPALLSAIKVGRSISSRRSISPRLVQQLAE